MRIIKPGWPRQARQHQEGANRACADKPGWLRQARQHQEGANRACADKPGCLRQARRHREGANRAFHFFLILVCFAQPVIQAQTQRMGLFVGANQGGPGRETLRHAHFDAEGISRVFTEMGGISPDHARLLFDPPVAQLVETLAELSAPKAGADAPAELVFYYSGHSDDEGLRLKDGLLPYGNLRKALEKIPVGFRLVILDSCASGSFTRAKGGKKQHGFLSPSPMSPQGMAVLTSSAPHEVSRESDILGGSFFTLSLITALRGAAPSDPEGRISLFEAYRFAYRETTGRTGAIPGLPQAQHPTFEMNLSGSGEIYLTQKATNMGELILAPELNGFFTLRSKAGGELLSQMQKPLGREIRQKLPLGDIRLTCVSDEGHFDGTVTLRPGMPERVTPSRLVLRVARLPSTESRAGGQALLASLGGGIGAGGMFFIFSLLGQAMDPNAPKGVYLTLDTPFVMALTGSVLGELIFPPLIVHGLGGGTQKESTMGAAFLGSLAGVLIAAPLTYALAYGKSGGELLPGLLPIFIPGLTATLAWQLGAKKKSPVNVYFLPFPHDLRMGLVLSF